MILAKKVKEWGSALGKEGEKKPPDKAFFWKAEKKEYKGGAKGRKNQPLSCSRTAAPLKLSKKAAAGLERVVEIKNKRKKKPSATSNHRPAGGPRKKKKARIGKEERAAAAAGPRRKVEETSCSTLFSAGERATKKERFFFSTNSTKKKGKKGKSC